MLCFFIEIISVDAAVFGGGSIIPFLTDKKDIEALRSEVTYPKVIWFVDDGAGILVQLL